MARLIDADELLKDNTWEWFDEWGNYTSAGQAIADAPTVDAVEVVHGTWEAYPDRSHKRCSVCKREYNVFESNFVGKYCPNCGAKMDGGDK